MDSAKLVALSSEAADLDEKARRWCELIVGASAEADEIIESMLTFGSPQRLRLETVDPQELLETAVAQAGVSPQDTSVDVRCRATAPPFGADQIKLRQAIRNLVANAIGAQRSHGVARPRVDAEITLEHRIFDPFFTDHPEGTGLGLALVSTIVRLHGGSVRLSPEASPLGGARFVIRLPYHAADPAATTSSARSTE